VKFAGTILTKPNKDVGGIGPEKRTDPSSDLDRLVNTEPLKSLHVEHPVVKSPIGAFVSVNTFPLTKHLFSHKDSPFPRAASREI
jgi:hypothetical protein